MKNDRVKGEKVKREFLGTPRGGISKEFEEVGLLRKAVKRIQGEGLLKVFKKRGKLEFAGLSESLRKLAYIYRVFEERGF